MLLPVLLFTSVHCQFSACTSTALPFIAYFHHQVQFLGAVFGVKENYDLIYLVTHFYEISFYSQTFLHACKYCFRNSIYEGHFLGEIMIFANLGGKHVFATRDAVTPNNQTSTFRRNVVTSKRRYPIAQ